MTTYEDLWIKLRQSAAIAVADYMEPLPADEVAVKALDTGWLRRQLAVHEDYIRTVAMRMGLDPEQTVMAARKGHRWWAGLR